MIVQKYMSFKMPESKPSHKVQENAECFISAIGGPMQMLEMHR